MKCIFFLFALTWARICEEGEDNLQQNSTFKDQCDYRGDFSRCGDTCSFDKTYCQCGSSFSKIGEGHCCISSNETCTKEDGWNVVCENGSWHSMISPCSNNTDRSSVVTNYSNYLNSWDQIVVFDIRIHWMFNF